MNTVPAFSHPLQSHHPHPFPGFPQLSPHFHYIFPPTPTFSHKSTHFPQIHPKITQNHPKITQNHYISPQISPISTHIHIHIHIRIHFYTYIHTCIPCWMSEVIVWLMWVTGHRDYDVYPTLDCYTGTCIFRLKSCHHTCWTGVSNVCVSLVVY
jgi:hypothetical protein